MALSFLLAGSAPLAVTPAAIATSSQVIELNNDGVRALNASNFQLAIQKFQEALKLDSTYQRAKTNLGIAYNNYGLQLQSNPMKALEQFHKSLELAPDLDTTKKNIDGIIRMMNRDPNKFEDRVDLGDTCRKNADYTGAIVEYQAALQINNDASVHEKLGDVFRTLTRFSKAIPEYQAAIALKNTAALQIKLGQAYQSNKDVGNAIVAYGKALELNPNDSDVQSALVAGWNEALQANPLAPENHIGLGQAYQLSGDFGQAEAEYRQAMIFAKSRPDLRAKAQQLLTALPEEKKKAEVQNHIDKGVGYQESGNYDAAEQEYKAALSGAPNNDNIWANLGTLYQAKKEFAKALECYQKAASINAKNEIAIEGIKTATAAKKDKDIEALSRQGTELFKAGQYDKAIAVYQQLLQFDQKDAATHFNIGAAYQAKKEIDNAISEYRLAVQFDKDNKQYADALDDAIGVKAEPIIKNAIKAHEAKDYATAVQLYTEALKLRPKNDEVWYNLASAQYSRQDYQSAKTAYLEAYKIDPKGRVDDLYFIGTIEEHFGHGPEAMTQYKNYVQKAPSGTYASAANDRINALMKDMTATIKIKSESEIATEKEAADAYNAAVQLQQQKQYDQAIAKYQEAIAKKPMADYIYSLGTCYQANKNFDLAMQNYLKAQSMDKGNQDIDATIKLLKEDQAQPLVQDAIDKQKAGSLAEAIAGYQKALQLVPENAVIWTNLGSAQQASDDFQQARVSYQKGFDLDKKAQVGNLYLMGAIDENYGKGLQAKALYDQYLKADPTGPYAQPAKTRSDALAKNIGATEKLTTSSDRANLNTASDAYNKAVEFYNQKDWDNALSEGQKAVAAMPSEPAYTYFLGTAYQQKGDLDQATAQYKKALALTTDPGEQKQFQQALDYVANLKTGPLQEDADKKYGEKDFAGAAAAYQLVLNIDPNNVGALTFLGASQQNLGNFADAMKAYEKGFQVGGKEAADCLYFLGALYENASQAARAIENYTKYVQNA
ncbi:MAG: tetratricopeptide repeat protein, partial [Candidatus Obscuribacterales bacterium]|nr:tetratricopeptide repeat protein [Candidatus Obscuribacterales bacterium]